MCGGLTTNTSKMKMLINEKEFVKGLKINKQELQELKDKGLFFIKMSSQFFYKVEDFNNLKIKKNELLERHKN